MAYTALEIHLYPPTPTSVSRDTLGWHMRSPNLKYFQIAGHACMQPTLLDMILECLVPIHLSPTLRLYFMPISIFT